MRPLRADVIDLHLHTTASDGRLSPATLVARAAEAGLTTIAVTDHDTTAGLDEARAHATAAGLDLVTGIELTSVHAGRDVHILGYFFDPTNAPLAELLATQRTLRVARFREIGTRLAQAGASIDVDQLMAAALPGSSVGRPLLARELVARGYASSVQDAFDRYLAAGRPAFVPREGKGPSAFVDAIHAAGGLVSFAHPGVTKQDALIEPLVGDGLDAIEVYHSDHTPEMRETYLQLARRLGVLVTGGSDFHGDDGRHRPLGATSLPLADFAALRAAVEQRGGSRAAPTRALSTRAASTRDASTRDAGSA